MTLASSSAMIPRKSPTPADTASFRFCGIESMTSYWQYRNQKEQHAGAEYGSERLLPGIFVRQYDGEGEERVDAHAGRERNRIIRIERHHQSADGGGDAGCDEHRALVHSGLAENDRIDEHDIDHGQKRRYAGNEFSADISALLRQSEIPPEHGADRRLASPRR